MVEVIAMTTRKQPDPYWTVRGVSRGQDVCLVIEAATMTVAECFATKRGVDVVFVTEASRGDVAAAKAAGRVWRYTPEARLKCFGRPVGHLQAACLVLCGLATVLLDLKANRVPMKLSVPGQAIRLNIGSSGARSALLPIQAQATGRTFAAGQSAATPSNG
jgi:hypothetical protein